MLTVRLLTLKIRRLEVQLKFVFSKKVTKIDEIITNDLRLTGKSLTRFPLPRFLAYVRVSGGFLS